MAWDWVKKYWVLLVVIAFLIAIVDVTISSMLTCHPSGVQAATDKANQEQCSALQGPLLLSLLWLINGLDEHGEAVTAAFTIVLAISTIGLWSSTRKLWEAGEKQIEVARISAESAKKSAEVAERAFSHSRTPAFGFSCEKVSDIKPGVRFGVTINIMNLGSGTAYAVSCLFHCEIFPIERLKEPFKVLMPEPEFLVVSAQGKIVRTTQLKGPLTKDDADKINSGTAAICIWGLISYDDDGAVGTEPLSYVFTGTKADFGKCQIEIEETKTEDQAGG